MLYTLEVFITELCRFCGQVGRGGRFEDTASGTTLVICHSCLPGVTRNDPFRLVVPVPASGPHGPDSPSGLPSVQARADGGHGARGPHFKMPHAPRNGERPAGEPPVVPDADGEGNGEADFKMPHDPGSEEPPTAQSSVADDHDNKVGAGDSKTTPWWLCEAIKTHQRDAKWWPNWKDLKRLRAWCHILITGLDLRAKDGEKLGVPLIRIERTNTRTLGTYRPDPDSYAIGGTIVVNEKRLDDLPDFMEGVLMLVLLVRARQHQLGGDGSLDREGRALLKSKGVVVTAKGKITIADDVPYTPPKPWEAQATTFRQLLEDRGIAVPAEAEFPKPKEEGTTTNRLWSCTCQRCRVGRGMFLAVCTHCNQPFQPGDHVGKRLV